MIILSMAFEHYSIAEETLEAGQILENTAESVSPEKYAAQHLRIAAGLFQYVYEELIPGFPVRSEQRPIECYSWSSEFLSTLCLINVQELLIRGAITKRASPLLIAKLCKGVHLKYQEMNAKVFDKMNAHNDVFMALKTYLQWKTKIYQASTFRFLAKEWILIGKYGRGIAFLRRSFEILTSLKSEVSVEHSHHTLNKLRLFVLQEFHDTSADKTESENDNSSIYFDIIPQSASIEALDSKFTPIASKFCPPSVLDLVFFVSVTFK